MEIKEILSITEAASYLGVHTSTVYRWLKNPEIRIKLGAHKLVGKLGSRHAWRFRLSSLKLFLQGNGQSAGAGQANDGRAI